MFISNYVRSAIVSRLRPWLLEEPEVVVQLGLLASHGFAKNLVLNPSVLNPLIEDATRLEFRSVEIGEFCVRVRPWSSPSILVEVRGLRINLAPRGTVKRKYAYRNSATRKKKEIASLDPEGASLHDAIERLLSEEADRVLASWTDVFASCCQIKFHDILFQLQVMTSHACLLEIDECCLQSEFSQAASFLRKFLGSFFVLGKGSGLSISFNAVKFHLKENHQENSILSFYGLSVHANLLGYHLISSYLHVSATEMRLSPELIPLLLLMVDFFSSKEHGCLKTGRDLWKIAAGRINHLTLCTRYSLYNAVEMVVLWSRYVTMYSTLLTMVRSFAGACLVENVLNHPVDKKNIMQAKYQLGMVLELEERLTIEMVVKNTPGGSLQEISLLNRSLGGIKIFLAPLLQVALDSDLIHKRNLSSKNVHTGSQDGSKVILWSSPASPFPPNAITSDDSLNFFDNYLKKNIEDLWSYWMEVGEKHMVNNLHKDDAFLLCKLQSFQTESFIKDGAYAHANFSLNVGKMSLDLDYSSIFDVVLFYQQLVDHFHCRTSSGSNISSTLGISVERLGNNTEKGVDFYNKIVSSIFCTIPSKNIFVGAFIAGPSIRVSLDRFSNDVERKINPVIAPANGYYWFKVDIGSTEFVMLPASKSVLTVLFAEPHFEVQPRYIWLKEPRIIFTHQEQHIDNKFTSHECITLNAILKACLVDVSSGFDFTNQSHVVEPITFTTKVSIRREYQHSFYAMDDFLSVVFSALTSSATFLVYMDELENLFKFFEGMLRQLAVSCSDITCNGPRSCWEFAKQLNDEFSVATDVSVVSQNSFLLIDATFEHETLDVVLDESRERSPSSRTSKIFGSLGCNRSYLSFPAPKTEARSLDMLDLSCFGLGFSLSKCCTKVFMEAETANVLIDLFGFQIVILDQQSLMRIASDIFQIKNILSEFLQHRHQFHLSCCTSCVSFQHGISGPSIPLNVIPRLDSENFQIPSSIEASYCSNARSSSLVGTDHKFELVDLHAIDTKKSISVCSLVVHIELGDIVVSEYHGANFVDRSDRSCKLELLMFVREGLPCVDCKIQGGCIFLEAFTFSKFLQCFLVYYVFISSFIPRRISVSRDSFSSRVSGNNFSIQDLPSSMDHAINSIASTSSETLQATKLNFVDVFTIDLKQFSLTLAFADGSGKAEELIIEVDVLLRLMDSGRKIIVDLYRLAIFTKHMHNNLVTETSELHMPHFCSTSTGSGSHSPSGENTSKDALCVSSGSINAPMPSNIFKNQLNKGASTSYSRHSILKCMVGSATLKKIDFTDDQLPVEFNSVWVGNVSISGLNLFIKISEIQMFLNVYLLLSKAFTLEDNSSLAPNFPQRNCERIVDSYCEIPDGAIVAIQDVQQHMYFAIEPVGKKYQLVGALHYFLVGKKALFKVRYHSSWRSKRPCMSFISLYAESNKGEPLCINFNPGSCFVGISGRDGDVSSLWQTIPNERNDFENEEMKLYERAQNGFNLVNLKNDCAVAFVDGIPEFVKKPGNQFKIKLFSTFVLSKDIAVNVSELYDTFDKYPKGETSSRGRERTEFQSVHQHINVKIDMVTLTICHEVSDVDDHLPLLRLCLDNIAILGQILLTKLRMLSSFSAVLHYFDSGMNIWREVLAPVEFSLFYRSRFAQPESLVGHHGPYVVRQAVIFPNCCKLENHTSLTALFQFQENQNVVLSQGQSSAAYLRHIALESQLPDNQNIIKISLLDSKGFSTSPISISLSDACFFAWRTRLASLEDSRIFPGPIVVIEVAKKNEESLSVVIAPLLRIHNKSTFTMELCFRRPEESSKESASVMLKHGDTVDDSKAMFEALDFDGGSRRTLMSLTLGNFLLSLRPQFPEYENNERNVSFSWSEEIKGEKAQRVSGMFDKLNYKFRKALGAGSLKSFYSILCCPITMEGQHASDMHF
ncbi:hypothetical protein HPP92_018739 [Vanilla planifolia]|uniref:Vacuolar protein sorting-associated protein 13 VPS13 adaptor binding domain-containing protein n=1 Tax=Vanilla planifolia TaxID=51239 RepID=A0A835QCL3_VANPL|nr:hypothetical protein HPP92_018739 [Vanilla planifolia]